MSRHVLLVADIQKTNLVATLTFLVSIDLYILPLFCRDTLLQHSSSSIFSPLCCDRGNLVVTNFLSYLLRCLSRHTELYRNIDCCNCSFSLLSSLNFLLFELKLAKHKVDE